MKTGRTDVENEQKTFPKLQSERKKDWMHSQCFEENILKRDKYQILQDGLTKCERIPCKPALENEKRPETYGVNKKPIFQKWIVPMKKPLMISGKKIFQNFHN